MLWPGTPRLCQEANLVPIVEPEVLMDGDHTLQRCFEVTERMQRAVFSEIFVQRVMLEGMILKPNMVVSGMASAKQATVDEVADATVNCLLRTVPPAVPVVAFLSGGQSAEQASAHLNSMNVRYKSRAPWALTFSYARAIQQPAMEMWKGDDANVDAGAKGSVSPGQDATGPRVAGNTAQRWRSDDGTSIPPLHLRTSQFEPEQSTI